MAKDTVPVTFRMDKVTLGTVERLAASLGKKRSAMLGELVEDGLAVGGNAVREELVKQKKESRRKGAGLTAHAGRVERRGRKKVERQATRPAGMNPDVVPPEVGRAVEKFLTTKEITNPVEGMERHGGDVEGRYRECRHGGNMYTCDRVACKMQTGRA